MRIKKLGLQTGYLKTLEEFYSSILQLNVQPLNETELLVKIGGTQLTFAETKEAEPFYHFAINIPSNKIEEAKTWLSDKVNLLWMEDYKSDISDFANWHAKSVYFYDPSGNIIELIARFDLNNEADDPFSPKQFICVSEVGLVFREDEFDDKIYWLLSKYALSFFNKQPPLRQFRAIGDDKGLFIVVPEHRNWYPTDKPAGIFPMTVEFENEGVNFMLEA